MRLVIPRRLFAAKDHQRVDVVGIGQATV